MAPQVVNIDLLLSSTELPQELFSSVNVVHDQIIKPTKQVPDIPKSKKSNGFASKKHHRQKRKYSATSFMQGGNPLNFIQNLLFPVGQSMAYVNEETLSSSFLILDGYKTISLWDNAGNNTSCQSVTNATERWSNRLETNICIGKVSYEYRLSDEVEKSMSHSSEEGDEDSNRASIVSQNLKRIPLVLDQEPDDTGTLLDPDRYLPPGHKMVADALNFQEYDQAVEVYEEILESDKERYGASDLVCAIDYHNLGVANLLANDMESALDYFQEAVILKRALLGHNDPTVPDSMVEIGIILYRSNDNTGALRIFKEALEIYKDSDNSEGMGRVSNNIGCVYYQMGDIASALDYLQDALVGQRMVLGMSEKAESSLLSFALTQSNIGYLKLHAGHLDAIAVLEESLLVLESVLLDNDITVETVRSNIAIAKHQKNQISRLDGKSVTVH
jgi:tetratricopeptide (TPR) repeat protein